jgi:hypothetical protein
MLHNPASLNQLVKVGETRISPEICLVGAFRYAIPAIRFSWTREVVGEALEAKQQKVTWCDSR